jgi:hypothetical protein
VRLFSIVLLASLISSAPAAAGAEGWPRGEIFIPDRLFPGKKGLDKVVMESNPRIVVNKEFDPKSDKIVMIGMDGWGGRSENFAGTLLFGLKGGGLEKRLVVACIQDTTTRGPRFQGQGDKPHANVWELTREGYDAMRHFVEKLADEFGHLRVYFVGYSSGSVAAPHVAWYVAQGPYQGKKYVVEGAVSLGVGANIKAEKLKQHNIRALFIVVPKQGKKEYKAHRYDQNKRVRAEMYAEKIKAGGGTVYLRYIDSAKRHYDWHWGLMSQCRYYKGTTYDDGRGYYPNYWMPNPDSWGLMSLFMLGKEPPEKLDNPPQKCPHPPNAHNPEDPDAGVRDLTRQTHWPLGTTPGNKGIP